MNRLFKYFILQYKHSPILNEALNIGILYFFDDIKTFKFSFPSNLERFKQLYPDFSISLLKAYLHSVAVKVDEVNNELAKTSVDHILFKEESQKLEDLVHKKILLQDSTALQFLEPKVGRIFSDFNKEIDQYTSSLVPYYDFKKEVINRQDEQYISRTFKRLVKPNKKVFKKIQEQKEIRLRDDFILKVDFIWKNGTTNLVKPLSFDLSDSQTIQNKALNPFATLTYNKDYLIENNYRFDYIVAKPQQEKLFKYFDKAIKFIEESKAPHKIIEFEKLGLYADKAISYLSQES